MAESPPVNSGLLRRRRRDLLFSSTVSSPPCKQQRIVNAESPGGVVDWDLAPLMRFMSRKRKRLLQRCRRQIRHRGLISSVAKIKGWPCPQDGSSQDDKGIRSGVDLPEDIVWHIHALMPLRHAARAACVSRAFLRSWRCHPYLIFSQEILGLDKNVFTDGEVTRNLVSKVNHILENHSGIGVKKLKLDFFSCTNVDSSYFDSWLHKAVTPGIEELTLIPPNDSNAEYSFPCSLLSNGNGNSIWNLNLSRCAIRPTVDLGCLTSLTTLDLFSVRITGSELEFLLSNSVALEWLRVGHCKEIVWLKIPCLLKRLHSLRVYECGMLKVVESYAPNLSSFYFSGRVVRMLGSLQVKNLQMSCLHTSSILCYALTKLLPVVPNVEKLTISSQIQIVSTPTVPGKFLRLKHLHMSLARNATFDYFSLVSFLNASPSLKTFVLNIVPIFPGHAPIVGDSAQLRQMPEHRHDNLKKFKIDGFQPAKSLVELTCHILETTSSLKRLELNTACGYERCDVSGECYPYSPDQIMETRNAVLAIRTYIVGKVPPTVKLNVVQPCRRCHAFVQ